MKLIVTIAAALVAALLVPTSAHADTDPLAAWHAAFSSADTGQANVAWIGSSTTYGNNATAPEKRYVNIVTTRLRGGNAEPVNRAGSTFPTRNTTPGVHGYLSAARGATSQTYVNNTTRPFILWEQPSLIVHMVGSNDAIDVEPYAVTVEEYEENIATQIDRLDAESPRPMSHLLVHSYRHTGTSVTKWATYGEALYRIAATHDNVLVLDISGQYEAADHLDADPRNLIDTDGTHQTDAGHAFMAELVADFLITGPGAEQAPEPTPVPEPEPSTTPTPMPTPTPEPAAPEATPAAQAPVPTATPAPSAPAASTPAAPNKVKAVRKAPRRTVVTWRTGTQAERYIVRCGRAEKSSTTQRAVLRATSTTCSVRSVNEAGVSAWVKARVRR